MSRIASRSSIIVACATVVVMIVVTVWLSVTASRGPVVVASSGAFGSDISVDVGTSVGFGMAAVRSSSELPVTNLTATLVPVGEMHGSVIDVYAVPSERWDLPMIAVEPWDMVKEHLGGHQIRLDEFFLTRVSGDVNILFKIKANEAGRSDWSHIVVSYDYQGNTYSETINGSFALCAPKTLRCSG